MLNLLIQALEFWADRSDVELISGHGDPDSVYLVRYHLMNNRFFKLYLHYFLRSDLDDPHDHPWGFWTLMLRGAYTEELYDWRTRKFTTLRRIPGKNSLVSRNADAIHRVIVDRTLTQDQKDQAPMTLFFATKKTKEWGFIKNYKKGPKWVHWKEYVGIKE